MKLGRQQCLAPLLYNAGKTEIGRIKLHFQEIAGFKVIVEETSSPTNGFLFSLRMSGDNEIVGWDCLLSPELVILMLCRNYQYIWERMSSVWEECLNEERNRDQEARGSGKGQDTDGPEDVNRERERRSTEKRKGRKRGRKRRKEAKVWDLKDPGGKVGKEKRQKAKQVVSLKLSFLLSIADTE